MALIYVVVSLAVEAALMVAGHLKVPQHNFILAPVVLTVPPLLVAWICGYRRPKELIAVAILLSVLTLALTAIGGKLTGVSTGMTEPIIVRSLAGFLAAIIAAKQWKQTGAVAGVLVCVTVARLAFAGPVKTVIPPNESEVELTVVEKGITYKLYRAALWRVNPRSGKWVFIEQLYDPDFYAKNYVKRDGVIYRKAAKGELFPVKRRFSDDFENAKTLHDLIGLQRRWTEFVLQSPKAPSVSDYVRLRKRILSGQSGFLDNHVELSSEVVHSGKNALKCYSEAPARDMICAKTFISAELLHFVKGDDVWLSGWFYVPEGSAMPFTVMDLKTTFIKQYPGMRIVIADGKYACYQLKSANHPYYRQPRGKEVSFPVTRWVHLKAHLKLSEKDDGVIELWQNGTKIVDARGQTLPLASSVYNYLEVGITAHSTRPQPATLYVDDVFVSDQPFNEP
jgi:hypothetical protein